MKRRDLTESKRRIDAYLKEHPGATITQIKRDLKMGQYEYDKARGKVYPSEKVKYKKITPPVRDTGDMIFGPGTTVTAYMIKGSPADVARTLLGMGQ